MSEYLKMDKALCGLSPMNFTGLDYNRNGCEYTWSDLEFNLNDAPFKSDTAIIVTSYHGQLGWLKSTLSKYRESGKFVILSYDNPGYIWSNLDDPDWIIRHLPRPIHLKLSHSFLMKHTTYDADKRTGWFYDVKYAQGIVNNFPNFKYVYVTNGDCITERPEGFSELPNILGDGDIMSGQSTPGSTIHTACLFMKVDAFNKIMNYMTERMRYPVMASQSPECLLRDAVNVLKLKETFVKYPIASDGSVDYYCKENSDSTWKEVLGFRNLYHEFEYRENNGLEPLPSSYLDPYRDWIYFREDWRTTVCRYYETGDRRYLMMFWDRGKDSDYERKYLPLEHYGNEPIYK